MLFMDVSLGFGLLVEKKKQKSEDVTLGSEELFHIVENHFIV